MKNLSKIILCVFMCMILINIVQGAKDYGIYILILIGLGIAFVIFLLNTRAVDKSKEYLETGEHKIKSFKNRIMGVTDDED